ncbi:MAG: hypothetical protein ACD_85C00002G0005 [uncultured bacterium]|nr:MAG: hypothetical protein ACD_85C00002G0005 [uncultured bacterium]
MPSKRFMQTNKPTPWHKQVCNACLLICAVLLWGCAATSPVSQGASLKLPNPPSLTSRSSVLPYSNQWQTQVDSWLKEVRKSREKLMNTRLMNDSSTSPGPNAQAVEED